MNKFLQLLGTVVIMLALMCENTWFAEAVYREWGNPAGVLAFVAFWAAFLFAVWLGWYLKALSDQETRERGKGRQ